MVWEKNERRYLSHSQISTYRKCSMLYYWSYELGIKIIPPWVFGFGRSVEGGLNYNFNQKIQTRRDLPVNQVLEAYDFAFTSEFQKEEVDWQGENKGKVKDKGVKLVGKYHNERAPLIQPIAVQDRIKISFDNVDYDLLGFLDLVEEEDNIVDFKVSKKTPNESVVIESGQLTNYSLLYRVKYGKPENKVKLEYMVGLEKEEKIISLEATRTSQEIDAFLKMVAEVFDGITKKVFVPCSEMCWWCGLMNCGFYSRCKPRRTVIAMEKLQQKLEKEKKEKEAEAKAKKKAKGEEAKAKKEAKKSKVKKKGKMEAKTKCRNSLKHSGRL